MELQEIKKNLEMISSGKGIDFIGKDTIRETAAAAVKLADIQSRLHGYIDNIEKEYKDLYVNLTMEQALDMMKIFRYEGGDIK